MYTHTHIYITHAYIHTYRVHTYTPRWQLLLCRHLSISALSWFRVSVGCWLYLWSVCVCVVFVSAVLLLLCWCVGWGDVCWNSINNNVCMNCLCGLEDVVVVFCNGFICLCMYICVYVCVYVRRLLCDYFGGGGASLGASGSRVPSTTTNCPYRLHHHLPNYLTTQLQYLPTYLPTYLPNYPTLYLTLYLPLSLSPNNQQPWMKWSEVKCVSSRSRQLVKSGVMCKWFCVCVCHCQFVHLYFCFLFRQQVWMYFLRVLCFVWTKQTIFTLTALSFACSLFSLLSLNIF